MTGGEGREPGQQAPDMPRQPAGDYDAHQLAQLMNRYGARWEITRHRQRGAWEARRRDTLDDDVLTAADLDRLAAKLADAPAPPSRRLRSTADVRLEELRAGFPHWRIWVVTHAVGRYYTWCAQPLPLLNCESADDLAAEMSAVDAERQAWCER